MPIFITQGKWTQKAIAGLVAKPEDREAQVRGLYERAGGRLLHYYVTFGQYDFLIVGELPDAQSAMSALATAVAGGGVSDTNTTLAVSTAEAKEAFEAAGRTAGQFRSAGT